MPAVAAQFADYILALHVIAVVVAFGVTFAYPILFVAAERMDRRLVPALHRAQVTISRSLISPGLLVVLLAGIYLASHDHQWKRFYVQWGLAIVVVLGGLEGAFITPRLRRLAEIGTRDLGAAGGEWSQEYLKLRKQAGVASGFMSLLVLITIVLMTTHG